jgi:hypothetical protein
MKNLGGCQGWVRGQWHSMGRQDSGTSLGEKIQKHAEAVQPVLAVVLCGPSDCLDDVSVASSKQVTQSSASRPPSPHLRSSLQLMRTLRGSASSNTIWLMESKRRNTTTLPFCTCRRDTGTQHSAHQ